ncbi:siderophore-interacting protein [Micromonospora chalcea]|uniref:siderophore-interacting protein n=1 Tax=Micromonospora chalcea TaxID=1874 RepID=UPI0016572D29|nr:siderophore-interacting protein [Micromonospora chalcea]MBC8991460.1 siderophore-interacting protein [Micromonospora chalcea]
MGITSRLKDLAESALLTQAEVTTVDTVGEDFVRISLQSADLQSVRWTAGSKVQVRLPGEAWTMRTYTPLYWDVTAGRTDLLAYRHGHGPASTWFGQVKPGDHVRFMGPRRSIEAPAAGERILFVGDESSVALACAFATTGADTAHLLQAAQPAALAATLALLDPGLDADICRTGDPAALLDNLRALATAMRDPYRLVVTGDAATVHTVRREVRSWATQPAKITGKAYWAAGRSGLD